MVKTDLDKTHLLGALDATRNLKREWFSAIHPSLDPQPPFIGIYAADGMSLDTFTKHFHAWVREALPDGRTPLARQMIPDVIYVRRRYACIHPQGTSDPFVVVDVENLGDGAALLMFVATLYQRHRYGNSLPWWIREWEAWNKLLGEDDESMRAEKNVHPRTVIQWPPGF